MREAFKRVFGRGRWEEELRGQFNGWDWIKLAVIESRNGRYPHNTCFFGMLKFGISEIIMQRFVFQALA